MLETLEKDKRAKILEEDLFDILEYLRMRELPPDELVKKAIKSASAYGAAVFDGEHIHKAVAHGFVLIIYGDISWIAPHDMLYLGPLLDKLLDICGTRQARKATPAEQT